MDEEAHTHFNTNLTPSEYEELRKKLGERYTVLTIKENDENEKIFLVPKWVASKYFNEGYKNFLDYIKENNLYTMIKGGKMGYALETNNEKVKALIENTRSGKKRGLARKR